jgi:rod shape-determining protein MreB
MKRKYNLLIGDPTAEKIKIHIGNAFNTGETRTMEVKGRDLVAGLPKTLTITSDEIREALQEPVNADRRSGAQRARAHPAGAFGRHRRQGHRARRRRRAAEGPRHAAAEETGLPVMIADDPLSAVVLGCGKALDEISLLKSVAIEA